MKRFFNTILIVFICQISVGQNYIGKVKAVNQNGLYEILLTPEVRSLAKNNLNYIRIYDADKNEVPYVSANDNFSELNYESFQIVSKKAVDTVSTTVIILNEHSKKIDELTLEIANTNVSKHYSISGSNDNNEWFGLVYNQNVHDLNEQGKTTVKRIFSFPLNNYKYLKFEFKDKNSLPINVISAGLQKNSFTNNTLISLTNFKQKITIDKKKKQTQILISFDNPQVINTIKFTIIAPNFYLRDAHIYLKKTRMVQKQKQSYLETITSFDLDSKKSNQFNIPSIFVNQFVIKIDNADNPPLEIADIELFQNPESLIADLKANEQYSIVINDTFKMPAYDLGQSGINLNQKYPETSISNLQKVTPDEPEVAVKSFWQTSIFMWICIGLAVIILGYFTIAMIKDVDKKENE